MAVDMSMNVLIVDDYKTMLRILRNLLRQLNFGNCPGRFLKKVLDVGI